MLKKLGFDAGNTGRDGFSAYRRVSRRAVAPQPPSSLVYFRRARERERKFSSRAILSFYCLFRNSLEFHGGGRDALSLSLSFYRLQGGVSGFFFRVHGAQRATGEAARFLTVLVVARLAFAANN